jgi:hypothetical protein
MIVVGYHVLTTSTNVTLVVKNHSCRILPTNSATVVLSRYEVEVKLDVRVSPTAASCAVGVGVTSRSEWLLPESVQVSCLVLAHVDVVEPLVTLILEMAAPTTVTPSSGHSGSSRGVRIVTIATVTHSLL